ncbi:spermine/spermidine synthase [Hortaea werneckii]|uniref:PABS domain-containing protein n=2 Tax=Hortaea werneckii TaxID=91943 RepID=A0A3M7FLS1_HORWE|nr:spermine/spermidine synthase [Hortaea werneckii]KAI6858737.1 spermine/spermidine synthase [Hortaea werneckii]KAI7352943.1 spermine/spermidine synthase [Hortaea werneckii]RMY89785.1 hypothetical protein D0862_10143 [Hortaea werneckii]
MAKGRQTVQLPASQRKHDKSSVQSATQQAMESSPFSPKTIRQVVGVALPVLTLAALLSPIYQQTLAPVYGAIPASINHTETLMATFLIGYVWRVLLQKVHTEFSILPYLAFWIFWMPGLQTWIFKYSNGLGPIFGPILTGFMSCHGMMIATGYAVSQALEGLELQSQLGDVAGIAIPVVVLDLYLKVVEQAMGSAFLPWLGTLSDHFASPVKLQLMIGSCVTLVSPEKPYWMFSLALPAALYGLLANPHYDGGRNFDLLNTEIAAFNWTLLDRAWSNTGYVSVLESTDLNYRVMRCDHSLLGGEWLLTPERRANGWMVNEPIYSVFEMLEAVRLMEVDPPIRDSDAQALVVGLGIGTAPRSLMAHGINTTTLELDPKVFEYATKYFALPPGHNVITDAVSWVSQASKEESQKYDYILHDVFTGGVEPLSLFTNSFLSDLRNLLTPNGVIGLNYAGDLSTPLTNLVLNTIHGAFDGQCKIFRDAPPKDTSNDAESKEDFLNMLIFCRNTPGSITFRQPTSKDFLGSKSRAHYLLPRSEWEIGFPTSEDAGVPAGQVLQAGDERKWKKEQEESAIRHWNIMRTVLPAKVWEMW